jgi:polar amino acid transport system substrate-binding protein
MKRLLLAATAVVAVAVAGCAAGSTPTLPSVPAPSSSSAPSPSPTPSRPGCNDNDPTRVESYAPNGPLPAPGDLPAGTTMAAIKKRGKIIVGVSADNLLFGFRNPISGQLEGFDIDMVKEVAKAIFGDNISGKIEYRVENFSQRIPDLMSKRVDMVADIMTINCARWSQIAFSTEYFHSGQQVLVRKDAPYQSIQDLAGKKVCAAKGSSGQANLAKFPKVKAEIVDNISDCMVLFQQGTVEGVISDKTVLSGFASQDPYAVITTPKITDEPYGLGFPAGNVDFVQFVNAKLEQMRADGTWASIYRKWLPDKPPPPPAAVYGRALP